MQVQIAPIDTATIAQQKKITQAATKEIIAVLDALLLPNSATSLSERGRGRSRSCGLRSLGGSGRSLIKILQDSAALVKHKKSWMGLIHKSRKDVALSRSPLQLMPTDTGIFRKGLLSTSSVLTIEVSFPSC